jgi:hypothetical protein
VAHGVEVFRRRRETAYVRPALVSRGCFETLRLRHRHAFRALEIDEMGERSAMQRRQAHHQAGGMIARRDREILAPEMRWRANAHQEIVDRGQAGHFFHGDAADFLFGKSVSTR